MSCYEFVLLWNKNKIGISYNLNIAGYILQRSMRDVVSVGEVDKTGRDNIQWK